MCGGSMGLLLPIGQIVLPFLIYYAWANQSQGMYYAALAFAAIIAFLTAINVFGYLDISHSYGSRREKMEVY
jgi:hypothetical protein